MLAKDDAAYPHIHILPPPPPPTHTSLQLELCTCITNYSEPKLTTLCFNASINLSISSIEVLCSAKQQNKNIIRTVYVRNLRQFRHSLSMVKITNFLSCI